MMSRRQNIVCFAVAALLGFAMSVVPAAAEAERKYQCDSFEDYPIPFLQQLWQGTDGFFYRANTDFLEDFSMADDSVAQLRHLQDALQKKGVTVILSIVPSRGMMLDDGYRRLVGTEIDFDRDAAIDDFAEAQEALRAAGIVVPRILEKFLDYDGGELLYYRGDHHWSTFGARETARAIGETIRAHPYYEGLKKLEFETVRRGDSALDSTMLEAIEARCGQRGHSEPFPLFVTSKTSSDASDLFGDAPKPEIVLIGTSYSAVTAFNFAGFIQQETGLEVANRALAGGDMSHAIRQYLTSDEFQDEPPTFLVWEIPGYYRFQSKGLPRIIRQATAAVHGNCGAEALASGKGGSGSDLTVTVPDGDAVTGRDHYIAVSTQNDIPLLRLTLTYANGMEESILLEDGFRNHFSRHFYWELADDLTSALVEVTASRPDKGPVEGTMLNVCRK